MNKHIDWKRMGYWFGTLIFITIITLFYHVILPRDWLATSTNPNPFIEWFSCLATAVFSLALVWIIWKLITIIVNVMGGLGNFVVDLKDYCVDYFYHNGEKKEQEK